MKITDNEYDVYRQGKFGQSEFSNMEIRTIRIFQHENSDNPNFLDRTLVLLDRTLVIRFFCHIDDNIDDVGSMS